MGLSFFAVVAAFFILLNKKELYLSQAQYSTGFTAEKVRLVDGTSGIDIYTADVKFNNAIETFKSPKVITMISYKLLLHDLTNPDKAYRKLSQKNAQSDLARAVNKDTAIRKLQQMITQNTLLGSETSADKALIEYFKLWGYDYDTMLKNMVIERVGRTDYLDIRFWSENPNLSALVVNSMGQEFLNYYKSLSSQRTEENAEGIKKIVSAQQERVDSLGKRLYSEKMKQGSIDPVSLSTSAMETVKELETRLAEEKSKQNEHLNRRKYLTERLNNLQAGNTGGVAGSSKEEIVRLTNRKNDLVAQLAAKGGSDAIIEKQIADLRAEINSKSSSGGNKNSAGRQKEIDNLSMQISEEEALLNAANSTIADYTSRIRKYTGMANAAPVGSDVMIQGIQSKLAIENAQLGIVMEKYSQAEGLVRDDPTTNFIQTAVGQPALGPESKKTMITMAVSGMSMFFLSSVIFLLLEIFDPRVKTPTLFRKQVPMNLVNILNAAPLRKASAQEIILNDYEGKKYAREVLFKNNIRKLRYELLNSPHKIFLFTSTQERAGKTTVLEALASSLVLSKKKVLIIDLNFAHNSITTTHNPAVLIQDIASKIKYDKPLNTQNLWSNSEQQGLSVIGCEPGNFTPSEILYNIDIDAFFNLLKDEFDFILLEGAALNDFADSRELATYAEEVYTVFSANAPVGHADEKSIKFLTSLGAKNKGTVLNNVLKENINF